MSKNSTLFFCLNEKDEKQEFNPDGFPRIFTVSQDKTNSFSVIKGLYKESIKGNHSPNISLILAAHGSSGNFSFNGESSLHPAQIIQRAVAESPTAITSHVNLDLFGCQVGTGVAKDRDDKQFLDPADATKKILYERNEQYYKDFLPENSSVILNGGNKKILIPFVKYLIEDLQLEIKRGGVLNEDSSAFDKVLFKIFQSPNTVKLAYKDKAGETHFFKSSAIKPLSKADTNPENIKRHMLNEMKEFVEWSKALVTPKEHAQLKSNLAKLEKRITSEHLRNYGDMALSLEFVRGKTKYAQPYFDNGYQLINSPLYQNKFGTSEIGLLKFVLQENKEFFLKNSEELNRREKNALLIAAINGNFEEHGAEIIDKLISSPHFNPNSHHPELGTPLTAAISSNDEKLVRRLVALGAKIDQLSVDEKGNRFRSPLEEAIIRADVGVVRSLLESKLFNDLDGNSYPDASSAIIYTISNCQKKEERLKILEMLLTKGCDPNYENKANNFGLPLILMVQQKDVDAIRLMTKHKADLNHISARYGTPLLAAIKNNDQDMVRVLRELGADVNLKTQFGTPLNNAIKLGNLAAAEVLIELGAKVNDNDIAKAKGIPKMMQLLHNAKAQQDIAPATKTAPHLKPVVTTVTATKPAVATSAKPTATKPVTVIKSPPQKISPAPVPTPTSISTKAENPLQPPKTPVSNQIQRASRPKSPLPQTQLRVAAEQMVFTREAHDKETGQEKRHISITKDDFRDELGQRLKSNEAEDRQKVTPQDFSFTISPDQQRVELKGSALIKSSGEFEADFADFGGLEFVEEKGGAKFFGKGLQLKNSSFRNCILSGVDFSGFSAENFKTLSFVGCKLQNCLLPAGIKMTEELDAKGNTILKGIDTKTTAPTEYSNMQVKTPQRPGSAASRRSATSMAQPLNATFAEALR